MAGSSAADDAPRAGAGLPIRQYSQQIVDAVEQNAVTVIIGETGSGKTTQIAQLLDEAGLTERGRIAVTQPRRVAAVSVGRRVAQELGCEVGQEVGYAVRFEERTSRSTRITYLTDGTLMRELLDDPELRKYAVVVLDEAHERTLNTDILFGVLKRLVKLRSPELKLVVTSATLDSDKFSAYYGGCPVLTVPGRCHSVTVVHAQENHERDHLQASVDTVLDIHVHQPPGDILLFLTGQAEIDKAVKQLNEAVAALPEGACDDLLVLPIYSALPLEMQARVFSRPPAGCRRVVVATNIAETSITIDGVAYVVDPGLVKQKSYNPHTGLDSLDVVPISRVQATQRAGRAGRTGPGTCFRLYTAQFYEREMPNATVPEIQRTSLLSAVLYLKSLPLAFDVLGFDYLDPPGRGALEDALRQLYLLDALDSDGRVTALGRAMCALPLEPSLARSLLAAVDLDCLPDALTVAAMLSAESVFAGNRAPEQLARGEQGSGRPGGREQQRQGIPESGRKQLKELMAEGLGDHVLYLRLFQAWERTGWAAEWCRELGLDLRGMRFAKDVRRQLETIAGADGASLLKAADRVPGGAAAPDAPGERARKRRRTEDKGAERLRRALMLGFANRLARRMPQHNGYKTLGAGATLAQLHPATARIAADDSGLLPEWLIYHELVATARTFLSKVCPVEGEWAEEVLPKLRGVDVERLSGGATAAKAAARPAEPEPMGVVPQAALQIIRKNDAGAVDDARKRFLARKAARNK